MFPWYVTQLPRLLRSFNHLEQKFLNVLLSFFYAFSLPASTSSVGICLFFCFFALVVGKFSFVDPNYVILSLSCG